MVKTTFYFKKTFNFRLFYIDKANGDAKEFEVSGSTYDPEEGELQMNGMRISGKEYPTLKELATICVLCNDAGLDYNEVK